ncbi:MAG: GNAT family N-acetyltransferase [Methanobacteriota archaeon]|nr:MAG: GNAT family N-acetyltransferase [Euryarchaeota archaeon]
MDIRIREATREDQDLIWKATMETVWNDLPPDERRHFDRATLERHFRPHAKQVLESTDNSILVAEGPDASILGYAIVGSASTMLSPVPFGFVYDVWVAPEARRRGVARRLLAAAEDWCRAQGYRKLKLEVAASNVAARALYTADGFAEERIFMGRPL